MPWLRLIFSLFLFVVTQTSYAQNEERITYDTTYQVTENNGVYDTVIYVRKHVEIVEHYFVIDSLYNKRWAIDFFGGIMAFSSGQDFPDVAVNANRKGSGYDFGASLYYNFKSGLQVRTGLQVQQFKEKRSYLEPYTKEVAYTEQVVDTLDSYYVVDNFTDTAYYHITETSERSGVNQVSDYHNYESEHTFWYLQVPVQIGYSVNKRNWGCAFLAGVGLQFLLHQEESLNDAFVSAGIEGRTSTANSFNGQFLGSMQFHYAITEHSLIQLEPQYQRALSKNNFSYYPTDVLYVRLGLKHFF